MARGNMAHAVEWHSERGRALDFLRAVDAALDEIRLNPFLYQVVAKEIRRALQRRFPYGLMYVVREYEVVVLTCFHDRRDPRRWRDFVR
jgi:plasmid stabilization system protein ParE